MTSFSLRALAQAALLTALFAEPCVASAGEGTQSDAPITQAQYQALNERITRLTDRDAVENLFSRYMYLHSAFEDHQIPALWVKRARPAYLRNTAIMACIIHGTAS